MKFGPTLNRLQWLTLLLALVFSGSGCGSNKPVLNVFTWSEYFDPTLIEAFEKEFSCVVRLDYYEDPESMLAKLAAGGASSYDIVVPSDTTLPPMVQRGLLAPLRQENIPNLRNIEPQFRDAPYDPGSQYSAPMDWGTTGIYLRSTNGTVPEASWKIVFEPGTQAGSFLLIEDARACIGAALKFKGYSANSTNATELAAARELLIGAKNRSLGFEGGTGCKNRVLSRGAAMAVCYSGDGLRGMKEDAETQYLIPKEGTQIFVDLLSIPAQAPHRELAEKFINFCLDARNAAQFANAAHYASPNQAAKPYLDMKDLSNPLIYPPAEIMERLEFMRDLGPANQLFDELWTQVKAK